jgi:ribonuclease VapC
MVIDTSAVIAILQKEVEAQQFADLIAATAKAAYLTYGKGYYPARLHVGDCCSHALVKTTGEPLLFKGNDFSQTDILVVSK